MSDPGKSPPEGDRQLVVLGASAGGLEALGAVLEPIAPDFPAPIVVVQHMDPRRPSHLAEILQRRTKLKVQPVEGGMTLEAGNVYVLPADHAFRFTADELAPIADGRDRPTPSIDAALVSAAAAFGEGLIAVILTGSGSDGAVGAREVKANGGTVVIQNPDTADYRSMPSAVAPPIVDIIAELDAIGVLLGELVSMPITRRGEEERLVRTFLNQVRERSGIDFTSYKQGTILRRLQRRIVATNSSGLRDYIRYLTDHPEEYQRLTSSFLIKVTEFFRDVELFEKLRDDILPRLIAEARERDRSLRIWSAGCATGEEAYSLAMLVADALGNELSQFNVRIFATDVDLDAIAFARRGIYPANALSGVPEAVRERHFVRNGDQYEIRKGIRALTIFGQHDLGHRAPFPRVDLALCRNVLIYFTSELQKRALQLFAFALRDGGYLVLGKAETTSPLPQYFSLEMARERIYRRQGERVLIPPARIRDTTPLLPTRQAVRGRGPWPVGAEAGQDAGGRGVSAERSDQVLLRLPIGIVIVDRSYDIRSINAEARRLLSIHGQAIGDDLIHMLNGEVAATIKRGIDAVFDGSAVPPTVVEVTQASGAASETRSVQISCHAGPTDTTRIESAVVLALDVSASATNKRELEEQVRHGSDERSRLSDQVGSMATSNADLIRANQELANANTELRSANEELLVANEEVQAATEEVETLNEELQATNEELETLNEELQATVEELNATNDDLEARSVELQEVAISAEAQRLEADVERAHLGVILDLVEAAVLVVDAAGVTVRANTRFRELVGDPDAVELRAADGSPFAEGADPRQRASRERFDDEEVAVGTKRFTVTGMPTEVDGDGRYGALVFRLPTA